MLPKLPIDLTPRGMSYLTIGVVLVALLMAFGLVPMARQRQALQAEMRHLDGVLEKQRLLKPLAKALAGEAKGLAPLPLEMSGGLSAMAAVQDVVPRLTRLGRESGLERASFVPVAESLAQEPRRLLVNMQGVAPAGTMRTFLLRLALSPAVGSVERLELEATEAGLACAAQIAVRLPEGPAGAGGPGKAGLAAAGSPKP